VRESTTVRVSPGTRDGLRGLAQADDVTLDEEIARLVRAERQRRIGAALSSTDLSSDDEAWLRLGAGAVADDASR
jgi:hypothetical protein